MSEVHFFSVQPGQRPRIGVQLPKEMGYFADQHHWPISMEVPMGDTAIHARLPGFVMSREAALGHSTTFKLSKVRWELLLQDIDRTKLASSDDVLKEALIDFERPTLARSVYAPCGAAVWLRGKPLRYGRHEMAEAFFSQMGGIETFTRLRIEGSITPNDELRLRTDLLSDRFATLPLVDPPHIEMMRRYLAPRISRSKVEMESFLIAL